MSNTIAIPDLPPEVKAFMEDFYACTIDTGFRPLGRWFPTVPDDNNRGVFLDVTPLTLRWGPHPKVRLAWASALTKGKGDGTIAMTFLCALADKHRVWMELSVGSGPNGAKTSPKRRLFGFYARHGFVRERLPHGLTENMLRAPQEVKP